MPKSTRTVWGSEATDYFSTISQADRNEPHTWRYDKGAGAPESGPRYLEGYLSNINDGVAGLLRDVRSFHKS